MNARVLPSEGLERLVETLARQQYLVIGPTRRDGAIVLDEIASARELPVGWTDEQQPGRYRLRERNDEARFGHRVGPNGWRRYLAPPEVRLWRARKEDGHLAFEPSRTGPAKLAFFGVRPCDLAAIAILDRVYLGGPHVDPGYRARRAATLVIVVNCTEAGGTCFCASMGTGPRAVSGYDLALTELIDDGRHEVVMEVGTDRGMEVVATLEGRDASTADLETVARCAADAAETMGRRLQTEGLADLLYANLEHPAWDEVAARCLTCGNCTLACPTCFCSTTEDRPDLAGGGAERWKRWDSCFTREHSYIHGGFMRASARARYRQWMTHKLAGWHQQFGMSGCVGCGRCLTWCPAGIDITAVARAIRGDTADQPITE